MNYKFDTIVNKSEAEALKEMIFKRANARAQFLAENVQENIMETARESFVSKNNPFSQIIEEKTPEKEVVTQETISEEGIGFPQKTVNPQIKTQQITVIEKITSDALQANMIEARQGLSNKKSFMGALNFLNSQAAVSLIKTRADKFEMLV